MTITDGLISRTLDVPGARLRYEVRGDGPLLFLIGSPMAASDFAPLAHALAVDHTVVTYDPRGLAGSTIDDPDQDSTPELRADDVAAIFDAVGTDTADVFGSSGGAVTGLALVTRHPGRVGTLIAHEPPVTVLLADAAQQRAAAEDMVETFHRDGPEAAWMKFMANAGFDMNARDSGAPVGPEPTPDEQAKQLSDMTRFFDHEMRDTIAYRPDVSALKASSTRVVVGIGADSRQLLTCRTSTALCEQLGSSSVDFPGEHVGFIGAPGEFADRVREVLAT
ncbi:MULTISPECIES: alpha/beta hydrolase [unclassified Mycobacterium]|uniref:alpha/beta fold hydrolase n=1 Tax=unclassified Mycobacterium TaxID=2642494 RepID=UPI0029C83A9F|nr:MULTISPECIES: alpha/beta hydrolase [unclassified Mycobacterium]